MPDAHPLRLDRSRYHSSVHGEFQSTTHYWQDGLPFDALGHLVTDECSPEQLAKADAKAPRVQMSDVGCQRSEASDPSSDICHPTSEVNLELWAKGEARYLPGEVFAAIRERYNKSVTTFADAIEFLVNDVKLVTKEQASAKLLGMGGAAPAKEEA
jgi:hypothetical protein